LQVSWVPRGARTGRGWDMGYLLVCYWYSSLIDYSRFWAWWKIVF